VYPSGTPPYAARPFSSLPPRDPQRAGDPASGTASEGASPSTDEPRTETTLTTRVRINIPGSRPIPPVVVRKPVDGDNGAPAGDPGSPGGDSVAQDLPPGWTVGSGDVPAPVPAPAQPFPGSDAAAPAPPPAEPERREEKKEKPANDWFAPRKPVTPPSSSGNPFAPPPAAPSGPSAPAGHTTATDSTQPMSLAEFSDLAPKSPPAPPGFAGGTGGPGGGDYPFGGSDRPGVAGEYGSPSVSREEPAGPDTPVGGSPYVSGAAAGPFGSPVVGGPRPFPGAGTSSTVGSPSGPAGGTPYPSYQPAASPDALAGPTSGPAIGALGVSPDVGPSGGISGGAVVPGLGGLGATDGDTVAGGIPTITDPMTPPNVTRPVAADDEVYRLEESDGPEAKGRSKLILAGVGILAAAAVAYGAGLLMDHADVPAGTTVLGVNIGGKSKEEAARLLKSEFGKRQSDSITLTVGSKQAKLTPSAAGLGVDIDATVSDVAHRDYNPVDVIGSLFGSTRAAEPDWTVDSEKLTAQLNSMSSGASTSGSDGMVKFVDGKAVAVPGRAHEDVDVAGSVPKIIAAYEQHVADGADSAVTLSVRIVQPKVSQAQLNAAVNGFGKTAMSGLITVKAGDASIPFGPEISLPKFLTMVPDAKGDLQPHFDLKVLQELYGSTFDGVLLERGNGSRSAVTPQDVASAMMPALRTTDQGAKTVTLPNVAP
jgi:hypothetical protein